MVLKKLCIGLVAVLVFIPVAAYADSGVGVGTAKIILPGTLPAGNSYKLPDIAVYNTGTESSAYEMAMTFNEHQPELKPSSSWVNFSPRQFTLAPGESKMVGATVTIPSEAKSGDYYAYLEAHTVHIGHDGSTSAHISAAAAAKFYFSLQGLQPAPHKSTSEDTGSSKPSTLIQFLSQYSAYKAVGPDAVAHTDKS